MAPPSNHPPDPPYEPHPDNFVRDRKRMRADYGPYSYTKGMYVNGVQTPMKPRNIRIRSSIPIGIGVISVGLALWMLLDGIRISEAAIFFAFAGFMFLLAWTGFRTARLREQWEKENPDLAKHIDY